MMMIMIIRGVMIMIINNHNANIIDNDIMMIIINICTKPRAMM